jgi:hypothetical protein
VDDSDHVLMRMTIPGHLVKRKSKTKTTVSWRLDLLKDKQIADTYRAQIKDLSTVIDAMDEYQNIDQHQVDKVFEQVADVIRKAASVSIGCKISKGRGTGMVDTRVCCDPPETQEAYEVAMHSNWHQTGNFVTLRKQKNKEMKRLKGSVLTGCRRDCLTVEEGAWIYSLAGSKAAARHAIRIHARK